MTLLQALGEGGEEEEELEEEDDDANNPNITMVEADSDDMTRCIYIDSVDSGRSSDTGTHQSWTSSTSSTKSSSGHGGSSGSDTKTSSNATNPQIGKFVQLYIFQKLLKMTISYSFFQS